MGDLRALLGRTGDLRALLGRTWELFGCSSIARAILPIRVCSRYTAFSRAAAFAQRPGLIWICILKLILRLILIGDAPRPSALPFRHCVLAPAIIQMFVTRIAPLTKGLPECAHARVASRLGGPDSRVLACFAVAGDPQIQPRCGVTTHPNRPPSHAKEGRPADLAALRW